MNHSLIIDCPVPYSSDYCYITGPDGIQHKPDSSLQINSGLCFLSISEASASDNGTWICSIAQKNGLPDDTITIDVNVSVILENFSKRLLYRCPSWSSKCYTATWKPAKVTKWS
jgi:hypothetical protein